MGIIEYYRNYNFISYVLMPDRHLLFYSLIIYFKSVHELIPLCGIRFLDEKSKQNRVPP